MTDLEVDVPVHGHDTITPFEVHEHDGYRPHHHFWNSVTHTQWVSYRVPRNAGTRK